MIQTLCIFLLIAASNAAFSTLASYTCGVDLNQAGMGRTDYLLIGASGSLSGYTPPLANTSSLTINLTQTGTTPSGINSSGPGVSTFPTTLTSLTIAGFALGIDVLFGTPSYSSGLQLPTPRAGCAIAFSLNSSPSAGCQWFQAALPSTCTLNVYPGTSDPMFTAGIFDVSGLTITTGIGLTIATAQFLSGGQVKTIIARRTGVSTYPTLTMNSSSVFNAAVTNVGLAGSFGATFNTSSSIYALSSVTQLTVGSGAALSIYNMAGATVPTITLSASSSTASIKGGAT